MTQSATLICDYDGTFHESLAIYEPAFRAEYARLISRGLMKKRCISKEELARWIGMSAKDMWTDFAPDIPDEKRQQASARIGEDMIRLVELGKARLYPHAETVLAKLKGAGYSLVFLSNCKHAYMEAHRKAFHLDEYFDAWYCSEDYGWIAKERIFPDIARYFDAPYIVIGDRAFDIDIAKTHRLISIGCEYGYGAAEELKDATRSVNTVEEIPRAAEELCALSS